MADTEKRRRGQRIRDSIYDGPQEPVSVRLPTALVTRLRAQAEREQRPVSFLVRTMVLTQAECEQPAGAR